MTHADSADLYTCTLDSPDELIGDDSIIGIKCPISIKDLTPKDAYNEKKIKVHGSKIG